jgi:ribonucleotide reductase alpha subunit
MATFDMKVVKRNGSQESLSFDKILTRIRKLGEEAKINVNYQQLVMRVIDQLYDGIHTSKIDELTAEECACMSPTHIDYGILAGRVAISNYQKNCNKSFYKTMQKLYDFKDLHGVHCPIISDAVWKFTKKYKNEIEQMICHERDYLIDYFGFKTLERGYLLKYQGKPIETPQHMWMRVSVAIHCPPQKVKADADMTELLPLIKETYDLMSQKYFIHATPTLFNAGTPRQQLSSCYLIAMEDDSIDGIYNTLKDCALISKYSGGIGLHIHNIRSKNSHIRGTNGMTDGIVPMLRVFNNTARYVNQCFTPDTWVYSNRGPIQMHMIEDNDNTELVTIDGTFKRVNSISTNTVDEDLLEISTTHSMFPVCTTIQHELYLIRPNVSEKDSLHRCNDIKMSLKKGLITPYYCSANNAFVGDLMGYPIPTYENPNICDGILDTDYFKFYGIMLMCGQINEKKSTITIKSHCIDATQFAVGYLESRDVNFNILSSSLYEENDDSICILWNNSYNDILKINDAMLYDGMNKFAIYKQEQPFIHLEKHKLAKLLEGILISFQNVDNECFDDLQMHLETEKIAMEVRHALLRFGILAERMNGDKFSFAIQQNAAVRRLLNLNVGNAPSDGLNYFEWNGMLWTEIKTIHKKHYSGVVYDFNMMDNHNYLTDLGLVHNSGKRNGSIAIYLETWHADIEDFLDLRKNHGKEEYRARDLFYALWVSDLFMTRVKNDQMWSLMCPDECRGLPDVYGEEFDALYTKYETEGKYKKQISARQLWFKILDAQMETGTPYLLYKDAANKKSNQKNLGTIKSSNLCCEIIEYSDKDETAVCNLASIALPSFVDPETKEFNYEKLHQVVKVVTNNLNKVIDLNYYPTPKTQRSNLRHRPIGIGVQGLADTFVLMDVAFHSNEAKTINTLIFETIYHASLEKSCELVKERKDALKKTKSITSIFNEYEIALYRNNHTNKYCCAYSTFEGSPASKGILQFDMWGVVPSDRYDWSHLKNEIIEHGLRNSLLVAPMPTASTSQILGFNECFEPFTSNMYTRRTLAGEFIVVNKYLMKELIDLNLWNEEVKQAIIVNNGSIQSLTHLPKHLRDKYKITWEIPMRHLIDMAQDRGAFICQSQSMNLWIDTPNYNNLTSMHFYSWSKGLKTGIYYLRRKAKHQAQQFTVAPDQVEKLKKESDVEEESEPCITCSA